MKRILLSAWAFGLMAFGSLYAQDVTTFTFTGAMETYVVPAGVTELQIDCIAASGGYSDYPSGSPVQVPGDGGRVETTLSVTAGETLYIFVGGEGESPVAPAIGAGGFNGGGDGGVGASTYSGGGGGGASDIRMGGSTLTDRVVVAGGGGGAAYNYSSGDDGGAGGDLTGADGTSGGGLNNSYGTGGSPTAGGIGGIWGGYISGTPGSLGLGGFGGSNSSGGGGGGGYYGGGGGCWAGGGGGSSYADAALCTGTTHTQGYNSGDGMIIITVLCTPLDITVSADTICETDELVLSATSTLGGTVTWGGGVVDGVGFVPDSSGTLTYTATSSDPADCVSEVNIFSMDAPEFTLTALDVLAGSDGAVLLNLIDGLFPFTYDWDNDGTGDFDDDQNINGLDAGTYTVVVAHGNGCTRTDSATVNSQLSLIELDDSPAKLYPNPAYSTTTIEFPGEFDFTVINSAGEVVLNGSGKEKRMVDISNLATGNYVISVESEDNTYFLKLLKQ